MAQREYFKHELQFHVGDRTRRESKHKTLTDNSEHSPGVNSGILREYGKLAGSFRAATVNKGTYRAYGDGKAFKIGKAWVGSKPAKLSFKWIHVTPARFFYKVKDKNGLPRKKYLNPANDAEHAKQIAQAYGYGDAVNEMATLRKLVPSEHRYKDAHLNVKVGKYAKSPFEHEPLAKRLEMKRKTQESKEEERQLVRTRLAKERKMKRAENVSKTVEKSHATPDARGRSPTPSASPLHSGEFHHVHTSPLASPPAPIRKRKRRNNLESAVEYGKTKKRKTNNSQQYRFK
jgi:hypothetical protein